MTWQSIGAALVRARAGIILCSFAILTACGGSSDNNNTTSTELAFCDSTDFQQVLNAVPKVATAATNRKTAQAATTLTVHYKRKAGDYTGWQIHTWGAGADPGWNKGYNSTGNDSFGVIFQPTLSAETGSVGYLFHNGDTKDHGGADQGYTLHSGANEIWRIEGDTVTYTTNPDNAATPDITKVRVHYKRYDSGYANWGLHLWDGSGLNTAALPSGVTINEWSNPVVFSSMTGYATDSFGVSFDIPVLNPTDNAANPTTLQFIIHGTGSNAGNKDGWGDNNIKIPYAAMTIANKVGEIWLVQEDATVYYAKPDSRSASTTDAKAYWLTKNLIQWPKIDASGKFKLYYSATGQIVATKDAKVSGADGAIELTAGASVPADAATRFKYIAAGVVLSTAAKDADLIAAHAKQLVLVQEDDTGNVQNATTAQVAGAFDEMFSGAQSVSDLGATVASGKTTIKLWAPSAQKVRVCSYDSGSGKATAIEEATKDEATGVWTLSKTSDLSGKYYTYVVDVFVRGVGLVRNRVTDPYSVSLTTDSKRSYIADLGSSSLKPDGWDDAAKNPNPTLANQVDMSIYELHVRDFSANDSTVPDAHKGKYLAFTDTTSNGMKHLVALKNAGLTDVHLLPVFDIATVPESGCKTPTISSESVGDSDIAKKAITAIEDEDCFNWGYDPYHYTAPEGSYATDASDGAVRIKEFRQMVMALHAQGLRVGMDVVYNHTSTAGQNAKSVLDRIVPGYYQRLSASGTVTTDTCCSDTASENAMMAKLMTESVKTWATQYKIDSFRFDLMGFHPRKLMENLKTAVNTAAGRDVFLVGEGWNMGVVASGARFEQASQLSLNGSGIGTFSDRGRDRIRGGNYNQTRDQGYVTGYFYDQNDVASGQTKEGLMDFADAIRVALAGSLRTYTFTDRKDNAAANGTTVLYGSDPAGYVSQPQEVVNYYENHDNSTMWDAIVAKMPKATSLDDRVRSQSLAAALNSLSQGVAYFHAGSDILRSKSQTSDSFNSGDWFNRLDWTYTSNNYGVGTPIKADADIASTFLAAAVYKNYQPAGTQISAARDMFRDFLAIRNSSTLFRMRSAADIQSRLKFYNTGSAQEPTVIAAHLNGAGYTGATYSNVVYVVNVDKQAHSVVIGAEAGKSYTLHPVQAKSVDAVVKTSTYASGSGTFTVPARTAAVFVAQ
jgi:pullulanase/glycogen debranching enzyme